MTDSTPLTLQNRQRLIVPLVSLIILLIAFVPIFFLVDLDQIDITSFALAVTTFLLLFGWLAISAWNVPFEATFGSNLNIRKLMRERAYSHDMIVRWRFMHPESPPSQELPVDHGLIEIKLNDGTRFRAEVNRGEAERVRNWLIHIL